jgi:hypothetical protein
MLVRQGDLVLRNHPDPIPRDQASFRCAVSHQHVRKYESSQNIDFVLFGPVLVYEKSVLPIGRTSSYYSLALIKSDPLQVR